MGLIWNERIKLLATAVDRLSTVCLTVGVAAPISAFIYGSGISLGKLVAAC